MGSTFSALLYNQEAEQDAEGQFGAPPRHEASSLNELYYGPLPEAVAPTDLPLYEHPLPDSDILFGADTLNTAAAQSASSADAADTRRIGTKMALRMPVHLLRSTVSLKTSSPATGDTAAPAALHFMIHAEAAFVLKAFFCPEGLLPGVSTGGNTQVISAESQKALPAFFELPLEAGYHQTVAVPLSQDVLDSVATVPPPAAAAPPGTAADEAGGEADGTPATAEPDAPAPADPEAEIDSATNVPPAAAAHSSPEIEAIKPTLAIVLEARGLPAATASKQGHESPVGQITLVRLLGGCPDSGLPATPAQVSSRVAAQWLLANSLLFLYYDIFGAAPSPPPAAVVPTPVTALGTPAAVAPPGSGAPPPLDAESYLSASECVICLTDPRDTLVLPCRHLCLCGLCAEQLRISSSNSCPICRRPYASFLRITLGPEETTAPEQPGLQISQNV